MFVVLLKLKLQVVLIVAEVYTFPVDYLQHLCAVLPFIFRVLCIRYDGVVLDMLCVSIAVMDNCCTFF
uniref:Uncharacterized protein n=1 Tax=Arundo donax TaxID=35708 RepID=A0A0A9E1V6_ARUDO